jgi:hypothetical protein
MKNDRQYSTQEIEWDVYQIKQPMFEVTPKI